MIRDIVLLTCQAPPNTPAQYTHGVYQRFGALLRAAVDVADNVRLLAIYRAEPSEITVTSEELEIYYQGICGVPVQVTKAVIPPPKVRDEGKWEGMKRGLFDPLNFGTSDQVRAGPGLESVQRVLSSNPDLILAHKLKGFITLTQLASVSCPIALDLDDMEHKAALRVLRFPPHYPGKLLLLTRPLGLGWLEHHASRQAAVTFICSEQDKRWMERFIRARRVTVLPNAIDERPMLSVAPHSRNVIFVGALNYLPNAEAARWFIKEIWPQIIEHCPSATLTIAGRSPERVRGFDTAHPSISFPGYVPDLEPLYEKAQLVVCPLQAGGGTRIKIIEAAMYGRPVISTPLGAEGLDFQNPDEIRIKKDAAGFADECTRMIEDISACRSVATKAYERAIRQYSRKAFINKVGNVFRSIVNS